MGKHCGAHSILTVLLLFVTLIRQTIHSDTTLRACVLMEHGNPELFYDYDRSRAAVELAVEHANDAILPANVQVVQTYVDIGSTCSANNHVLPYALNLVLQNVTCHVFLGPGCGSAAEVVYDLADFLEIMLIGCPAAGIGTHAPISAYPFLVRLSITHTNTADTLVLFLNRHNYTALTVITDLDNSFYQQMGIVIKSIFDEAKIGAVSGTKFIDIHGDTLKQEDVVEDLSDNIRRSRVFILLMGANVTRQYMLTARQLHMTTGDYVYVGVELFDSHVWGNFTWYNNDSNDQDARDAYDSLLLLSLNVKRDVNTFTTFAKAVRKLSATKGYYNYTSDDQVDVITTHFYDAVVFYASLIAEAVKAGENIEKAQSYMVRYHNYTFSSPVNGDVRLNNDGDRVIPYMIWIFDYERGRFTEYISVTVDGTLELLGELDWHGTFNGLPPNEPYCGYLGDSPRCAAQASPALYVVAGLLPIIGMCLFFGFGFVCIRRYVENQLDPYWWRILRQEITIVGNISKSVAPPSTVLHDAESSNLLRASAETMDPSGTPVPNGNLNGLLPHPEAADLQLQPMDNIAHMKALYHDALIGIHGLPLPLQRVTSGFSRSLNPLHRLQHQNIQRFLGIVVNDENLCEFVAGELCQKGTLTELLDQYTFNLEWNFKCSLMKDCAAGVAYLHSTSVTSLGNLSSDTCLIDSNFTLKITDYGLWHFMDERDFKPPSRELDPPDRDYHRLLWRAPELLRMVLPPGGTQKGDTYSYAIILQQIILRTEPFGKVHVNHDLHDHHHATVDDNLSTREIVMEVKKGSTPLLRPRLPLSCLPVVGLHDLVERCWDENPEQRPNFPKIRDALAKLLGKSGDSIIDHLLRSMEKYATQLEYQANEKMHQFMEEKKRSEEILNQILPKSVAINLTKGGTIRPEVYLSTTLYFSDIPGFGGLIEAAQTAHDVLKLLNSLYATADMVIEQFDVYKVETSNDSYMIVSGLPILNGIQHASEIASMAILLRTSISSMSVPLAESTVSKVRLRVGINSGPCVAGIIGTKMPRYCLFGDTINTASRMETHGQAGKIHCSSSTKELLDQIGGYTWLPRGVIPIKGKGPMETYWLLGEESKPDHVSTGGTGGG